MGLAIINQLANYTLERKAQNVIPVDESKRVYLTNVTNFTYEYAGNGIYRLKSLNIGTATLPYVYALAFTANLSGAEIDPISGVVTIGNDFTGGNLKVVINPIYDQLYYPLTSGEPYQANTTILNPLTPDSSSVIPYNDLTITGFSYSTNTISANGGNSVAPSLNYSYTKVVNGLSTTVSNTGGTKEYTMHSISASGATVNATTGVVSIPANSTQTPKVFVIQAKVTVDDTYQTEVAKITQAAAATVVTYTYEFSNVSLSYPGTPIAAAGNTTGLYPELSYTLTKRGSDNSTESISASSIVYSVQGTQPSGVQLTSSNGKVTFAANATDNLVQVTIQATLTAPDGTEGLATVTLTQNQRTLNSISFKSYNGANAINITTGTTVNKSEISVNLIYDVGENGTGACTSIAVGGATGTLEPSHQFTEAGTYPMRIYHNSLYVDVLVTVTALAKAYITGFPSNPYPTDNSNVNVTADNSIISIPLRINVMTLENGELEMTFDYYVNNLNEPKETYNAPAVTFTRDTSFYNLPDRNNLEGVDQYGTLIFDLTKPNYIYDKSLITNITITPTNDPSNPKVYALDIEPNPHVLYTDYFTNESNFTTVDLTTATTQLLSDLGITRKTGLHVSSRSFGSTNKVAISSDGIYYEFSSSSIPANGYYFSILNGSYTGIISRASIASGASYTIDYVDVKGIESSSSKTAYIHHTPTSSTKTFILTYNNSSNSTEVSTIKLLIPNSNS